MFPIYLCTCKDSFVRSPFRITFQTEIGYKLYIDYQTIGYQWEVMKLYLEYFLQNW